jgi:SAM-dependent methyltransferase
MSKHDILTTKEVDSYSVNPETQRYLQLHCQKRDIEPADLKVLDWGCGRGRLVAALKSFGFDAFGVDIDYLPIKNGKPYFRKQGIDADNLLHLISKEGKTNFLDGYFDAVISDQVFEHVKDLDLVAAEISRITKPNGIGFHVYPAHRYITEGHLYLPFVHWLPKNNFRKFFILIFLIFGRGPKWKELENKSIKEQAHAYNIYSIRKTFYRSTNVVKKIFTENNFEVEFVSIDHPKIRKFRFMKNLVKNRLVKAIIEQLVLNFKIVELLVTKK